MPNSRISGLDDVMSNSPSELPPLTRHEPPLNQCDPIPQQLQFTEPLTETQRLMVQEPPISPTVPKVERQENNHVITIQDMGLSLKQ